VRCLARQQPLKSLVAPAFRSEASVYRRRVRHPLRRRDPRLTPRRVDVALEIYGKSLGVPIHRLLRGGVRERMPAYASGGWALSEVLATEARASRPSRFASAAWMSRTFRNVRSSIHRMTGSDFLALVALAVFVVLLRAFILHADASGPSRSRRRSRAAGISGPASTRSCLEVSRRHAQGTLDLDDGCMSDVLAIRPELPQLLSSPPQSRSGCGPAVELWENRSNRKRSSRPRQVGSRADRLCCYCLRLKNTSPSITSGGVMLAASG
jgi:hypothetical protein